MTTVNRTNRTTIHGRRRGSYYSDDSADSARAGGGTATRIARGVWRVIWLLAVPSIVAGFVDRQIGAGWGVIPAFWLGGDPKPAGLGVAGVLAVVGTFAVCAVMYRKGVDLQFGLLPIVGAVAAHLLTLYVVAVPVWAGVVAGLVAGVIWLAAGRRQRR